MKKICVQVIETLLNNDYPLRDGRYRIDYFDIDYFSFI